jgi:hydrogenase maturation protease
MDTGIHAKKILVLGVGNALMQDDGVGIHVTTALESSADLHPALQVIDGGTIGLALLPEIEDAAAVIVVDASEIGAEPGTLRVFRNEEIDRQLSGKRRTVHEVALLDLFAAAAIRGRMPPQRALVAIQPGCTEWGTEATAAVRAAVQRACATINRLADEWQTETRAA